MRTVQFTGVVRERGGGGDRRFRVFGRRWIPDRWVVVGLPVDDAVTERERPQWVMPGTVLRNGVPIVVRDLPIVNADGEPVEFPGMVSVGRPPSGHGQHAWDFGLERRMNGRVAVTAFCGLTVEAGLSVDAAEFMDAEGSCPTCKKEVRRHIDVL